MALQDTIQPFHLAWIACLSGSGFEAQEHLSLDAWRSSDDVSPLFGNALDVEDLSHRQK